jgi:hypothetical protein
MKIRWLSSYNLKRHKLLLPGEDDHIARDGRRQLLQSNVGSLSQTQFILVVIFSILGFLILTAAVLLIAYFYLNCWWVKWVNISCSGHRRVTAITSRDQPVLNWCVCVILPIGVWLVTCRSAAVMVNYDEQII